VSEITVAADDFPDEPSSTIAGSLRNGLLITPPMPARFVNSMKFEAEKIGGIVRRAVEAIKKSKSHRRASAKSLASLLRPHF
jgi:hypothetical protein